MGKLAGGTEEFAQKLAFSVGRHLVFWTLERLTDPAKVYVTLLIHCHISLFRNLRQCLDEVPFSEMGQRGSAILPVQPQVSRGES